MLGETVEAVKRREMLRSQIDAFKLETLVEEKFDSVDPEDGLSDVVSKMRPKDLHEIAVMEKGKRLLGVISMRSVIRRKNVVVGMKAKTVMEQPPQVTLSTPVTQAAEYFISTGFRQLPVQNGQKMIGIISRSGLVSIVPKIKDLRNMRVMDVMTPNVQTVKENDAVKRAIELMRQLDIQTLPVVDDEGSLTGIIGIRDIVHYNWNATQRGQTVGEIVGEKDPVEVKVGSLRTAAVFTVAPGTTFNDAAALMLEKNVSTLPVVEKSNLVGIVTAYDLIQLIASYGRRDIVYTQITGLEEEDRFSLDIMEKEIQSGLAKTAKVTKPMLFTMHVTKYHPNGNTAKYSLNARLFTEHGTFNGSSSDWSLIKATTELMNVLDERVTKKKEVRVANKKRSRSEVKKKR
ncbi:MAG TPA: CBS domain-containing protein [Methanomassiliicoccales archaeon]|nr:CBS domain-containing protein [Methanomassiliicoccales archaeon]